MMNESGIWDISPAYDITYANGAGYTKNHQLSLKGKNNNFTKKDLLDIAKQHSIKENEAYEIINQVLDIFSGFSSTAKLYDINQEFVKTIEKNLRLDIF